MLSIFPELLVYSLFAPFILRLGLGFVFIRFGGLALSSDRHRLTDSFESAHLNFPGFFAAILGIIELLVGLSLILGLYTQIGALVAGAISLILLISKLWGKPFGTEGALFDFVLLSISLSLMFSGAGFLAFDLPL